MGEFEEVPHTCGTIELTKGPSGAVQIRLSHQAPWAAEARVVG